MNEPVKFVVVRADTDVAELLFDKHDIVAVGYPEMGDLSSLTTLEEFIRRCEQIYPHKRGQVISDMAAELYSFVRGLKVGDLVVFPSELNPEFWIGEVVGDYAYQTYPDDNHPHVRAVKWRRKMPRSAFSGGARLQITCAPNVGQIFHPGPRARL